MRAQDLKFTKAELEKCFGKKKTRKQYLSSLLKQYDRKEDDDGNERSTKGNSIRFS